MNTSDTTEVENHKGNHFKNDMNIKDILPQNKNFFKYFLVLYSPVNLLKHNIFALFGKIKAVFLLVLLHHFGDIEFCIL